MPKDNKISALHWHVHLDVPGLVVVLGVERGVTEILDKEPEKRIRLKALLKRLSAGDAEVKEVILSLNATPDGENTTELIRGSITQTERAPKVTILGRGLSTGAELEYVDADTIKNALQGRH